VLQLAGQRHLDKAALVGACVRLRLAIDAPRLADEVRSLPASLWGTTGGRVGVHRAADGIFLRGFAPAEGNLPIEDRPALAHLPYVRQIIHSQIPAAPQRCLLARLPGGAVIAPHIDRAPYFSQTLRLHIAVTTHEQSFMYCAGFCYRMRLGELWALNNSALHGVLNGDETRERTHLICDFLPTEALLEMLADGERNLGEVRADVESLLTAPPRLQSIV
jgi:Aspartyl/Asparaginyl beta-hydroxylase